MITFRVKSNTDAKKLGGAIFTNIKNCDNITLSCLGAGALNQAIKSLIIARGIATPVGINLYFIPAFDVAEVDSQEKTLIKILIKKM